MSAAAQPDSRDWIANLRGPPAVRQQALTDLHALLLRGARIELKRRRELLGDVPQEELDGLAGEVANDALSAILTQLESFRGASRFTTWAYKFVVREAGVRAQREAWRGREIGFAVEVPESLRALRVAVKESLTPRQCDVLAALVLNDVPIDVLAEQLDTTRGALYGTLRDARRALRAATVDAGLSWPPSSSGRETPPTGAARGQRPPRRSGGS